jgi:hypothetical protein
MHQINLILANRAMDTFYSVNLNALFHQNREAKDNKAG